MLKFNLLFAQNSITFHKIDSEKSYSEKREIEIILSQNGVIRKSFTKILEPFQSTPEVKILDVNKFYLIFSQEGLIEFYENNEIHKKYFLYKTHQHNEQSIIADNNENNLAVLISENFLNRIFLFNENGEIKDSINVEDGITSGISFSGNGKFIAVSIYNWSDEKILNQTKIYNSNGNVISSINEKFAYGKFYDTDNLFLGFTNKNLFCFDIDENKVLWKENLASNEIYLDAIWNNENIVFIKSQNANLENGNWIYQNAEVISKSKFGEILNLNKFETSFKKAELKFLNNKFYLFFDDKNFEMKIN